MTKLLDVSSSRPGEWLVKTAHKMKHKRKRRKCTSRVDREVKERLLARKLLHFTDK